MKLPQPGRAALHLFDVRPPPPPPPPPPPNRASKVEPKLQLAQAATPAAAASGRSASPPAAQILPNPTPILATPLVAPRISPQAPTAAVPLSGIGTGDGGFGSAAIRLVQGARVRPVLRNGQPLEVPVLAPIAFLPVRKAPKAGKTK